MMDRFSEQNIIRLLKEAVAGIPIKKLSTKQMFGDAYSSCRARYSAADACPGESDALSPRMQFNTNVMHNFERTQERNVLTP